MPDHPQMTAFDVLQRHLRRASTNEALDAVVLGVKLAIQAGTLTGRQTARLLSDGKNKRAILTKRPDKWLVDGRWIDRESKPPARIPRKPRGKKLSKREQLAKAQRFAEEVRAAKKRAGTWKPGSAVQPDRPVNQHVHVTKSLSKRPSLDSRPPARMDDGAGYVVIERRE